MERKMLAKIQNLDERKIKIDTLKWFEEIVKIVNMSDKKFMKKHQSMDNMWPNTYFFDVDEWDTDLYLNQGLNKELINKLEQMNKDKILLIHNSNYIININYLKELMNENGIKFGEPSRLDSRTGEELFEGHHLFSIDRYESKENMQQMKQGKSK